MMRWKCWGVVAVLVAAFGSQASADPFSVVSTAVSPGGFDWVYTYTVTLVSPPETFTAPGDFVVVGDFVGYKAGSAKVNGVAVPNATWGFSTPGTTVVATPGSIPSSVTIGTAAIPNLLFTTAVPNPPGGQPPIATYVFTAISKGTPGAGSFGSNYIGTFGLTGTVAPVLVPTSSVILVPEPSSIVSALAMIAPVGLLIGCCYAVRRRNPLIVGENRSA